MILGTQIVEDMDTSEKVDKKEGVADLQVWNFKTLYVMYLYESMGCCGTWAW